MTRLFTAHFLDHFAKLREILDQKHVLLALYDVLACKIAKHPGDRLACRGNAAGDVAVNWDRPDFGLVLTGRNPARNHGFGYERAREGSTRADTAPK